MALTLLSPIPRQTTRNNTRLDDLSNRFEPPNAFNRWDRPLIRHTVRPRQERGAATGTEEAVCSGRGQEQGAEQGVYMQVLAALTEGRAVAASFSTAAVCYMHTCVFVYRRARLCAGLCVRYTCLRVSVCVNICETALSSIALSSLTSSHKPPNVFLPALSPLPVREEGQIQ